jgi:hypothetical protein
MKKLLIIMLALFNFKLVSFGQMPIANIVDRWVSGYQIVGSDTLLVDSLTGLGSANLKVTFCSEQLININNGFIDATSNCRIAGQPISTLFADSNYASLTFYELKESTLNSDSTLNLPYRCQSISRYSVAQIGEAKILLYKYFSVPKYPITGVIVVPEDQATITASLLAALDGDTILVKSGEYTTSGTHLNINKNVTIIGIGACVYTNGKSVSYGIIINASSKFEGFEIINSTANYSIYVNDKQADFSRLFISTGTGCFYSVLSTHSISIKKSYLSHSGSSSRTLDFKISDFTISDCNFVKTTNSYIYLSAGSNVNGTIQRCSFDDTTILYSIITPNSINFYSNTFNSQNSAVILFSTDNFSKIKKFCYNSGKINSIVSSSTNNVSNLYIRKNKIDKYGNSILVYLKNRNLSFVDNTIINHQRGSFISVISDSIIYCNIINNSFITALGNSSAGGIFIGDSLGTQNTITIDFSRNLINYSSGSNVHGIQIYNHKNAKIRYNYSINVDAPYIFKGNDHNFSGADISFNVDINGRILLKGVDSARVYNNTVLIEASKDMPCMWILPNGTFDPNDNLIYNNIFVNLAQTMTYAVLFDQGIGFKTISDYNIIYAVSNRNGMLYTNPYTFIEWQGLGRDANSYGTNPNFKSTTELWSLSGDAIGNGLNLGISYNLPININSIWPNSINTQTWSGNWDIGAFKITKPKLLIDNRTGRCILLFYNNKFLVN